MEVLNSRKSSIIAYVIFDAKKSIVQMMVGLAELRWYQRKRDNLWAYQYRLICMGELMRCVTILFAILSINLSNGCGGFTWISATTTRTANKSRALIFRVSFFWFSHKMTVHLMVEWFVCSLDEFIFWNERNTLNL